MLRSYPIALALLSACFFSACTKKGNTGPAGPTGPAGAPGPSYTGIVIGHVSLYDQYGSRQFTGIGNNVQVVLKGGAYTYTDSSGLFLFANVATGNYYLKATAPGYAATRIADFAFVKDSLYKDIKLSARPVFNIKTFDATRVPGSTNITLTLTVDADSRTRNCIVFVSSQPGVSGQPGSYVLAYTKAIGVNSTMVNISVPAADLNNAGIFFGQPVYFAACSYVVNDMSLYEDEATGMNVYNAVGVPIVDSALCP